MPRDIALNLGDRQFTGLFGGLLHTVEDLDTGETYPFLGDDVHDTRQQLAAFMKEWADRGTGRYEEEA